MTPLLALRLLITDTLYQVGSGHPGGALGMVEMGYALWQRHLRHAPHDPQWINRDRFVLSNGHTCMLLYALLHLTGYAVSREDLYALRSLHSITPGHPERGITPGVEVSTGPLGQGLANAVGFAIAEREMARQWNQPDYPLIDHHTYVFVGDGCLMEGIGHEVCALAGAQQLGKLVVLYDANRISMEGEVSPWFNEHVEQRFHSYHWQVIGPIDGHDPEAIDQALRAARADTAHPTLIICHTIIGRGLPLAGTAHTHGEDVRLEDKQHLYHFFEAEADPKTRLTLDPEVYTHYQPDPTPYEEWQDLYHRYCAAYPTEAKQFMARCQQIPNQLPKPVLPTMDKLSTRDATHHALSALAPHCPALIGASADMADCTRTRWADSVCILPTQAGQYLQCGVREFGMAAIMNGMAAYGGGFIPFDSTFLVFSDYSRSAIRMAALMGLWRIFVFTHDSIAVGGDGPTHQPIEQLMSLRFIPQLTVIRPCDLSETTDAWHYMLSTPGTYAIILSRQALPTHVSRENPFPVGAQRVRGTHTAQLIIVATGSEVSLACAAYDALVHTYSIAVVSLPSLDLFEQQNQQTQTNLIGHHIPILIVEAGRTRGWDLFYTQSRTVRVIGVDAFGLSAPGETVQQQYALTIEHIVHTVQIMLSA